MSLPIPLSEHRRRCAGVPTGDNFFLRLLVVSALMTFAPVSTLSATDVTPAALVNGTVIPERMVREIVKSIIAENPEPPSSAEIGRLTKQALESLIDLELLYQEAKLRHIEVTNERIDAEIQRSRARFDDPAKFADALRQSGMTEAQLREDTRKTLLANRLLEDVVWQDIEVSPDDVRNFYEENLRAFTRPAQARVLQIVIRPADQGENARSAAARKAADLRARVIAGEDLAHLAREHSDDENSAASGGDLGFVNPEAFPPPIEAAVLALPIGELSDVIESPDGYHLIQVNARRPSGTVPLAEVTDLIEQTLTREERQRRQRKFVAELRAKAKVEVLSDAATTAPASTADVKSDN